MPDQPVLSNNKQHTNNSQIQALIDGAIGCLEMVRIQRPAVHCITNTVAANTVANALLAIGAEPSMTSSIDEVSDFVQGARAVSINLGTLDTPLREAIVRAIDTANTHQIPWQLDPVFIQRSPTRLAFATELIHKSPSVIRGNLDEMQCLMSAIQGTDSLGTLSEHTGATLAVTGQQDLIVDQHRTVALSNGHPLMSRVTATGCASSALVAAFVAVENDTWLACASALCVLGVAGELAATTTNLPGSYHIALIDALFKIDSDAIKSKARFTPEN